MIKKPVVIQKDMSSEGRPIAHLVQEASQYHSQVYLEMEDKKINAKSIMGMMSLQLIPGEELTVVAEGSDEMAAAAGVVSFLSKSK